MATLGQQLHCCPFLLYAREVPQYNCRANRV